MTDVSIQFWDQSWMVILIYQAVTQRGLLAVIYLSGTAFRDLRPKGFSLVTFHVKQSTKAFAWLI
jgi:hypothetical protein